MRTWRHLPGERLELYSPIGLRLIDDFTGGAPLGRTRIMLDMSDGHGGWRTTDIKAVFTPSNVLAYPGLGRSAEVIGQPPRRYRVRVEPEFYRPFYRRIDEGLRFDGPPFYRETGTGIEFDTYPYNDPTPPQFIVSASFKITEQSVTELRRKGLPEEVLVKLGPLLNRLITGKGIFLAELGNQGIDQVSMARFGSLILEHAIIAPIRDLLLMPAANYPFPTHVRVLRGLVVFKIDGIEAPVADVRVKRKIPEVGTPVPDVEVNLANKERVLTDERGDFALPLRWAPSTGPIRIEAFDHRTERIGETTVTLPEALATSQKIELKPKPSPI